MNSRSARAQIQGVCFDREVIFKSLEPTTRVLSRGGVIEYRAFQYPYTPSHRARTQATTHCTSWRSDDSPPCLGGSSHRWVPVNTHSTPVPLRREAVGGSTTTSTPQRQRRVQTSHPFTRLRENIIASWQRSNDCEPMRISPSINAGRLTSVVCTQEVRSDRCDRDCDP